MAEVGETFLLEDDDVDFHGEETLISSYWSNSSFEEEEEDDEETLIQPPIFTPETLDHLVLDLGLGLGLGFDQEDVSTGPIIEPGLRIAGSDSESDTELYPVRDPELCWDCLRFDDTDPDAMEEGFLEWEEVEERSRTVAIDDLEDSEAMNTGWEIAIVPPIVQDEEEGEGPLDFDFMDPSEFEVLFGHFAEHDSPVRGPPPAAISAVASIPSVTVTEEEGDACAVCKEVMEGTVRRLPCSHRYHGECILPWLAVRNTCPVCRFELPTDDPEYECRRAGRYDLEMFTAI